MIKLGRNLGKVRRALVDSGGVVFATGHDLPLLKRLCGRAIYLRNGSIRAEGPFSDVERVYLDDVHAGTHD